MTAVEERPLKARAFLAQAAASSGILHIALPWARRPAHCHVTLCGPEPLNCAGGYDDASNRSPCRRYLGIGGQSGSRPLSLWANGVTWATVVASANKLARIAWAVGPFAPLL